MRKEIVISVSATVISGALIGIFAYMQGVAANELTKAEISKVAKEIVEDKICSETLIDKLAGDRRFIGPKGNDGVDNVPVGTLVASLLPPLEFVPQTQKNSKKLWALADGSRVPAGSDYMIEFCSSGSGCDLPDLKGKFLMGTEDRESVGSAQPSSIKDHNHKLELSKWTGGAAGNWAAAYSGTGEDRGTAGQHDGYLQTPMMMSSSLPNKTRPEHVPVFWYVKINSP